jgi:CheY-like chemotaxis protein
VILSSNFVELLTSAYASLYDIVQLRVHPLIDLLLNNPELDLKERGWQLHKLLLAVIDELDPGPNAPPSSKEWRRHRLLLLRYVDGMDPQQVAHQLMISRRQYYREHHTAMEAIGTILQSRIPPSGSVLNSPISHTDDLLHLEVMRVNQQEQHITDLEEVIEGVLGLMEEITKDQNTTLHYYIQPGISDVPVSRSVLRQVLLGVLGVIIAHSESMRLELNTQSRQGFVYLSIATQSPHLLSVPELQEQLEPYWGMLQLSCPQVEISRDELSGGIIQIVLPVHTRNPVLVIDDNHDMLELYDRFLSANHFQVFRAMDAENALKLAYQIKPSVIILDLMMPETDGWEILRSLRTHPEIASIPVIICSVLKQRDLALALGAAAFLEKPITESALLAAITSL